MTSKSFVSKVSTSLSIVMALIAVQFISGCASDPANSAREKITKVQSRGLKLSDEEKAAFNDSVCAPSTCANNVVTLQRWDSASVQCVKSDVHPCYPYACGQGDGKNKFCASECTSNAHCSAGALCNNKKQCVPVSLRESDIEIYREKSKEPAPVATPAPVEAAPAPTATPAAAAPAPEAAAVVSMPASDPAPAPKKPAVKKKK